MFTEEDEYIEDEEDIEEGDSYDNDDEQESQTETEDKEMYFMGTQSQARKRFNTNRSRPVYRNRFNFNQRQSLYYTPNCDRSRSNTRTQNTYQRTLGTNSRTHTNTQQTPQTFTRCVGCRCTNCIQIKTDCRDIKKMLEKLSSTKVHEVSTKDSNV